MKLLINKNNWFKKLRGFACREQRLNNYKLANTGRTNIEEATLEKEIYFSDVYFSHDQIRSFTDQLQLVHNLNKKNILEIGIGNGFVSDFLRKADFNVTTFDINHNLKPDIVGSVLNLKDIFKPPKFDVILCAEVLEHLPFELFDEALSNIARTTNKYAILTLPISRKIIFEIKFSIKLPRLSCIENGLVLSIPKSNIISEHHWEIDAREETKLKAINLIINKHFTIVDANRFKFRSNHYYFVLEKRLFV